MARLILSSPCVLDELPRVPQKEQRFLTALQVNALAQSIEAPYELLVLLLAYTGMRYGDLKKTVAEMVVAHLGPMQERYREIVADPSYLDSVLAEGAARVTPIANSTVHLVKSRMGLYTS